MAAMTIFDRLQRRPAPAEAKIEQPNHAQRMLDFLLQWPQDTIRLNQILVYGPRPRKREIAINAAAILVAQKWIIPRTTPRPDMIEWQIVRRPIVHPTIAT